MENLNTIRNELLQAIENIRKERLKLLWEYETDDQNILFALELQWQYTNGKLNAYRDAIKTLEKYFTEV